MCLSVAARNSILSISSVRLRLLVALLLLTSHSLAFLFPSGSFQSLQRQSMSTCRATERNLASSDVHSEEDATKKKTTLKVLLLHGKGSSGDDFVSRLENYSDVLRDEHQGMALDVVTVDGPIALEEGFAWWNMPPFVRSYNATEYEGFETSAKLVLDAIEHQGPFDVIYGHSQGAILTTALLALQRISVHPQRGYVLNGVAWPNPFSKEMESLHFSETKKPNVLLITGLNDKINAPDTQEQVKKSLLAAGAHLSQICHPAGHNIPMQKGQTLSSVVEWMVQ